MSLARVCGGYGLAERVTPYESSANWCDQCDSSVSHCTGVNNHQCSAYSGHSAAVLRQYCDECGKGDTFLGKDAPKGDTL